MRLIRTVERLALSRLWTRDIREPIRLPNTMKPQRTDIPSYCLQWDIGDGQQRSIRGLRGSITGPMGEEDAAHDLVYVSRLRILLKPCHCLCIGISYHPRHRWRYQQHPDLDAEGSTWLQSRRRQHPRCYRGRLQGGDQLHRTSCRNGRIDQWLADLEQMAIEETSQVLWHRKLVEVKVKRAS